MKEKELRATERVKRETYMLEWQEEKEKCQKTARRRDEMLEDREGGA